ncbi:MAG: hypothetical protein IT292_04460 [Deltaproteobacteria bacterium]|nr:hypothetical protein [Deltaproteobacteria bacterium]
MRTYQYSKPIFCSQRRKRSQSGQVLVIGLFFILGLSMMAFGVANIGMAVGEKIKLQDAVDGAAYSAAVHEARYMNLSAYINRAMIANYSTIAFNQALWATADGYDHGLAVTGATLYAVSTIAMIIPFGQPFAVQLKSIADVITAVHDVIHDINKFLKELFSQDDEDKDANGYIESYNTMILSLYQGLLYSALQSTRHKIVREVAHRTDPEAITTTVLGLGADEVSAKELADAIDFVISDPEDGIAAVAPLNRAFDRLHGRNLNDDRDNIMLGTMIEASLDSFSAGRNRAGEELLLRQLNTGNLLPMSDIIEDALEAICYASASWVFGDDCDRDIKFRVGSFLLDTDEDVIGEGHVPFVSRQRIREAEFFGLRIDIDLGGGVEFFLPEFIKGFLHADVGYSSGYKDTDIHNIANYITPSQRGSTCSVCRNPNCRFSVPGVGNWMNFLRCAGSGCLHNQLNYAIGALVFGLIYPPDAHWDGNTDVKPIPVLAIPPRLDLIPRYIAAVAGNLSKGTPAYDLDVNLDNVGVTNYERVDSDDEVRFGLPSFQGPSIVVIGVKRQEDVNSLHGLRLGPRGHGIGNSYDMTAMARSQVYFLHNPKRPQERPSIYNPHWAARLAPIESDNVPEMIRRGLPYVSSYGLPFTMAH